MLQQEEVVGDAQHVEVKNTCLFPFFVVVVVVLCFFLFSFLSLLER